MRNLFFQCRPKGQRGKGGCVVYIRPLSRGAARFSATPLPGWVGRSQRCMDRPALLAACRLPQWPRPPRRGALWPCLSFACGLCAALQHCPGILPKELSKPGVKRNQNLILLRSSLHRLSPTIITAAKQDPQLAAAAFLHFWIKVVCLYLFPCQSLLFVACFIC